MIKEAIALAAVPCGIILIVLIAALYAVYVMSDYMDNNKH